MKKFLKCNPVLIPQKIELTSDVKQMLCKKEISHALSRHFSCDWGDVNFLEWQQNDIAFKSGGSILSRYTSRDGILYGIMSDEENTVTIVLLSEKYEKKGA